VTAVLPRKDAARVLKTAHKVPGSTTTVETLVTDAEHFAQRAHAA
jgi:hypothetical protein